MTATGSRIAVLMTCHNRRDATVACLDSLRRASNAAEADLRVFLVDDGSSDGTAEAAAAAWPGLVLLEGDGNLYWAGGMALAEQTARRRMPDADHLLWLNDDVLLDPDALKVLLDTAAARPRSIVVGAMRDGAGELSYSGIRLTSRWHPLRFERITPGSEPTEAEAMNGNLVLVPTRIADATGGIDDRYSQQAADFDYAIRARAGGANVVIAPGTLGVCPRNPGQPEPRSLAERWRRFNDPVGLGTRDQARFIRRHGPVWSRPLLLAVPYVQFAAGELARLPVLGRLIPSRALRSPRS